MMIGCPTGSAMPLMWAHAEYIKLLRSVRDGQVFDLIPAVAGRYLSQIDCVPLEVWKFNRQPASALPGSTLRVQASSEFMLRWTVNEWQDVYDTRSRATALGIEYVDISVSHEQRSPIRFTLYWVKANEWEGQDFQVAIHLE